MRLKHTCATMFAGLIMTHAQGADLISPASKWQFYDSPDSPSPNWYKADYDRSLWLSGFAEFGYGDGNEATITSFGEDPDNKPVSQYFAKKFTIEDLANIDALKLRVLADDGAVVYINGNEAFRLNLPANQDHDTLAIDSAIESVWIEKTIPTSILRQGDNLIAVEVHQLYRNSSDISFDLGLTYTPIKVIPTIKSSSEKNSSHLSAGEAESVSVTQSKAFSSVYKVILGEGASSLAIETAGGSGDADLYVRYGEAPTLVDWDKRPYKPGNNEVVNFQSPQAGTYYISLYAYTAFADIQLRASWQDDSQQGRVKDSDDVQISLSTTKNRSLTDSELVTYWQERDVDDAPASKR